MISSLYAHHIRRNALHNTSVLLRVNLTWSQNSPLTQLVIKENSIREHQETSWACCETAEAWQADSRLQRQSPISCYDSALLQFQNAKSPLSWSKKSQLAPICWSI